MPCINVDNKEKAEQYKSERKKKTPWMLLHYADWCGHCDAIKENWTNFENQNKNMNIARLNANMITAGHVTTDAEVKGYPAINFVNGNGKIVDYEGDRSVKSLNEFARNSLKQYGGSKRSKRKTKSKRKNNKRRNTKRRNIKYRRNSNNKVRYYKGGGILDSIETKLQKLENMIGTNTFE